jgi:prepilin-type N-terminal cleavage/methylation domain-containing protein
MENQCSPRDILTPRRVALRRGIVTSLRVDSGSGAIRLATRSRTVDGCSADAFSLIEILCAILVLAVALTGMVQAVTTALGSTKESELQTVAASFAAGQVETLRAEGDLQDGTTEGECGEGLSLYQWQQTIAPAGIDGLHDVTLVVQNTKSGKPIYELKTLLFEIPDDSGASSTKSRRDSTSQRRRNNSR